MQPTHEKWGVRLSSVKAEYLQELFGILLHRCIYSLLFIYSVSQSVIHISMDSWIFESLWYTPINVGFVLSFPYFLALCCTFPPYLESSIFSKETCSLCWRRVLATKIWALGAHAAPGVWMLLGSLIWQSKVIYVWTPTHVYSHIYRFFYKWSSVPALSWAWVHIDVSSSNPIFKIQKLKGKSK